MKDSIPARHGQSWTKEEEQLLVEKFKEGATLLELCVALERKGQALMSKLNKLGHYCQDHNYRFRNPHPRKQAIMADFQQYSNSTFSTVASLTEALNFFAKGE